MSTFRVTESLHDRVECAPCQVCAVSAETHARVTGSVGATSQMTVEGVTTHSATVRRQYDTDGHRYVGYLDRNTGREACRYCDRTPSWH